MIGLWKIKGGCEISHFDDLLATGEDNFYVWSHGKKKFTPGDKISGEVIA